MWIILLLLGLGLLGVHTANVIKALDGVKDPDVLYVANLIVVSPLILYAIIAFGCVAISLGLEKVARRLKDKA